jgi:hypothetical protein
MANSSAAVHKLTLTVVLRYSYTGTAANLCATSSPPEIIIYDSTSNSSAATVLQSVQYGDHASGLPTPKAQRSTLNEPHQAPDSAITVASDNSTSCVPQGAPSDTPCTRCTPRRRVTSRSWTRQNSYTSVSYCCPLCPGLLPCNVPDAQAGRVPSCKEQSCGTLCGTL